MKNPLLVALCLGGVLTAATTHAIDLKQSKVTQVVNDVQIISAADQKQKAAVVDDIFAMPDILRTGAASRAELVARDETVTRVGANTIFSFDPASRTIDLKQGSLLFHAPHGKGGGSIHTGSATASVLGTTLIVTTTSNGGFKVIALEGQVEVRFLNGLKQKLDPGQMTFVLPGANQLAPIVIFRLDELIQNSLLVKGFAQTLQSLPLIQEQIDSQLKLIHAGKLTDTGLYAGDNAGPNQVEVLDVNTITHGNQVKPPAQPAPPPPPPPPPPAPDLADAEAADATINQPSLTDASLPTPPVHVITDIQFALENNTFFSGMNFAGFVARNIFLNTEGSSFGGEARPTLGGFPRNLAGALSVDLSPYASLATFDIVAVNDISIEGSIAFNGLSAANNLSLIAGNQFSFTSGIALEADVNNFLLSSPASLTLDNLSVYNAANDVTLRSGADISFQDNSLVNAAGNLAVYAGGNLSIANSQLLGATAVFTSVSGTIQVDAATLEVPSHSIFIAPVAINFNDSTINSDFTTLSGTAAATISLNDTTINGSSSIVVSAPNEVDVTGSAGTSELRSHDDSGNSALLADPASGTVSLSSSFGSVIVTGTSISAHYLTLNSGDGILLDATGNTVTASGSGATANFTAPNLITVNNADLTSYAVVNMAANTIVLSDVAFAGTVTLRSLLGIWNNGSVVQGAVNDLGGVTYNRTLVNAANGSSGLLAGTGITVGTLH
ncbi:MAG: FecR family protein [Verrucomicrobiota bacterium]